MSKYHLSLSALSLATTLGFAGAVSAQPDDVPVEARGLKHQYAVKFLCGQVGGAAEEGGIVAPGRYFTAINVHNPTQKTVASFRKKVAQALPWQKPGPVSKFSEGRLGPDLAMEVDCPEILKMLGAAPGKAAKGFLVIESSVELDVVGVYSAAAGQGVSTLFMERVPRRPITP